jgi:hypothetical protein
MLDVSLERRRTLEYLENEAPPTDRKRPGTGSCVCSFMKILVTPGKVTPFHPSVLCYLQVGNPDDLGVARHGNNVGTTWKQQTTS